MIYDRHLPATGLIGVDGVTNIYHILSLLPLAIRESIMSSKLPLLHAATSCFVKQIASLESVLSHRLSFLDGRELRLGP